MGVAGPSLSYPGRAEAAKYLSSREGGSAVTYKHASLTPIAVLNIEDDTEMFQA
jgi:hypothetical protein